MGPTQRTHPRAAAQSPVHDAARRSYLCHQRREAQIEQPVRVSRLQETKAHRSQLHLPAAAAHVKGPGSLDSEGRRFAVRHQVNAAKLWQILSQRRCNQLIDCRKIVVKLLVRPCSLQCELHLRCICLPCTYTFEIRFRLQIVCGAQVPHKKCE